MKAVITAAAAATLLAGATMANAQSANNSRVPNPSEGPANAQSGTLPPGVAPSDSKAPSTTDRTTGSAIGNPGAGQPGKSQRDQSTTRGPVMDTPPGGGEAQSPTR